MALEFLIYIYMNLALLFTGNYLIVITKKTKIGEFFNHVIWKATDFDVLSYKKTMLHLTDIQVRNGSTYLIIAKPKGSSPEVGRGRWTTKSWFLCLII